MKRKMVEPNGQANEAVEDFEREALLSSSVSQDSDLSSDHHPGRLFKQNSEHVGSKRGVKYDATRGAFDYEAVVDLSRRHGIPVQSFLTAPSQRLASFGMTRIVGCLMVGVVLAIMYGIVSSVFYHYKAYWLVRVDISVLLILFSITGVLLVVSYLQTCLTEPGQVPLEWHSKIAQMQQAKRGLEDGRNHEDWTHDYAQCRRSKLYKPPRASFDMMTYKLVLNMDHFCPWVNNCVGFFNRKFFVLFLIYAFIGCLMACIMLFPYSSKCSIG